jgi:hypothetical protein
MSSSNRIDACEQREKPTMREWLAASESWEPVDVREPPAIAIAAERDRDTGES